MTDDLTDIGCPEAERALLGAVLDAPAQAAEILAGIRPEDFADPRARDVFGAITRLLTEGTPPDAVTVLGALRRAGELPSLARASAGPYLHDVMRGSSGAAMAGHYRRVVVEHSWRRRVAEAGTRLTQAAPDASVDTLADLVGREIGDLLAATRRATAPATEGATA